MITIMYSPLSNRKMWTIQNYDPDGVKVSEANPEQVADTWFVVVEATSNNHNCFSLSQSAALC